MTTISAKIPETLFRRALAIAEREEITLDQFIAIAVASQISSWGTGKSFEERAAKGNWDEFRKILAKAPDVEPAEEDRLN
ncbi:MAG: hypothetical protein KF831_02970 [Acidobacteria bacterium]|nr:hypothetical protein [Acidobacteriota bacterium]